MNPSFHLYCDLGPKSLARTDAIFIKLKGTDEPAAEALKPNWDCEKYSYL